MNKNRCKYIYGFSLAEMMVVMLILAIVLVASAPVLTRKAAMSSSPYSAKILNQIIKDDVNKSVNDAVNGSIKDSTNKAINDAINGSIKDNTNKAVNDGINNAINGSINDAINIAINNAINGAIKDAINKAVNDAINNAINNTLKNYIDTAVNDAVSKAVPKGIILVWSGSTSNIPDGWVLCDGGYGTPDLRSRFVYGAGYHAVGDQGGAETHLLTISEMPSHNHTTQGGTLGDGYGTGGPDGYTNSYGHRWWHTYPTGYEGGNLAFSIMPRYYALAYIMKIK